MMPVALDDWVLADGSGAGYDNCGGWVGWGDDCGLGKDSGYSGPTPRLVVAEEAEE